jgi:hypothetical protein
MFKFFVINANHVKAPEFTVADLDAMCERARKLAADRSVAEFHVFGPDGVIGPEALRRLCGRHWLLTGPPSSRAWRATGRKRRQRKPPHLGEVQGLLSPGSADAVGGPQCPRRGTRDGR